MSDNDINDITDVIMEDIEPKKVGRPPHLPDADTQKQVYELSKVGTRYEDIATMLSISADTLTKYYPEELKKGRIEANAVIAGTLYEKAKSGDTTSMIFWLKSRAQWKETQKHEHGGDPDGEPIQVKVITGID
jgi:hypothetical protein